MRILAVLVLCAMVGGCGLIARKELQEKQQAAIAEKQTGFIECKTRFPEGSSLTTKASEAPPANFGCHRMATHVRQTAAPLDQGLRSPDRARRFRLAACADKFY